MRDFFIQSLGKIISVLIIIMALAVVVGGIGAIFQGQFLSGIGILIAGAIYVLVMGGFLYLALGVYDNTKRTAEAVENLLAKG
jgi:hypothetical protein